MAANTTPVFTLVSHIGMVRIATANTGRDGSGTLNTVLTGGTNGTRVDRIIVTATGATTAGMVRFFINDGTNTRLWKELPVSAVSTPSGTVQAFTATILSPDTQIPLLVLPANYLLTCAPHNAETFDVVAQGGDF